MEKKSEYTFTEPQLAHILALQQQGASLSEIAEKYQVSMDEDTLLAEANKWELSHGGLSGRTAQQFINYLLGKE